MKIEQIYTGCLAQGAYYLESNGEAAIIDPLREVQPYIDLAQKRNAKIKYIFETHFHADFVSGHIDLANKTGARIIYGPTDLKTGFASTIGHDGQIFELGKSTIKLIHTPGHTMESSCFLLIDEHGKEKAIFTGDTLFIGDVGRPDLAQHVISELTEDILAGHLYDSLQHKIMPLSNDLIVYPGHGAGSACGKNMSKETFDTLGNQKKVNYALQPNLTKTKFIKDLLTGLTPPPSYFPKNVLMNINGYESIDNVMHEGLKALSAAAFDMVSRDSEALIIDTRDAISFSGGFIPGAINIGIDGNFAVWVGTLVTDIQQKLLLVIDQGREEEVIKRLARVGYDNAMGYLKGGMDAWQMEHKPVDSISNISAFELAEINPAASQILDVRKQSEFDSESLVNAINVPLDFIHDHYGNIDKNQTYYVHCAAGYRSMAYISILKSKGFKHLINVAGGFNAIKEKGNMKVTGYVCPSTML